MVEFLKCKNLLKSKALEVEYLDEAVEFVKMESINEDFIDESENVEETLEIEHPVDVKKDLKKPKTESIDIVGSILDDSIEIDDDFDMPEMEFADYAEEVGGHRPHIILHPSYLKILEQHKNEQSTKSISPLKIAKTTTISSINTEVILNSTTGQEFYPFKCLKCEIIYANQEELDHHMIDHLFEEGPQKCQQCRSRFKTAIHYKRHMKKDHKGQKYICNVCGNLYLSQPKLTCHLRTHNLQKKYACTFEDCTKAFRIKVNVH